MNLEKLYLTFMDWIFKRSIVLVSLIVLMYSIIYLDANINGYWILKYSFLNIFIYHNLNMIYKYIQFNNSNFKSISNNSKLIKLWNIIVVRVINVLFRIFFIVITIISVFTVYVLEEMVFKINYIGYAILIITGAGSLNHLFVDKYNKMKQKYK